MKTLITFAFLLCVMLPAQAQTSKPTGDVTGKWTGTFTRTAPSGETQTANFMMDLTQKGKALTGTAGPPDQQWKIDKATVTGGKATFEVQQPDGPLFKFALSIVKGRLQGEMSGEREGVVRGRARVDAAKAAKVK